MAKRVKTKETERPVRNNDIREFVEEMQAGIQIDPHGLDDAVMQQADLFFRVSERLAITISRRDQAKDNLKTTEAEVESIVREDAEQEEKKMTEAAIKNAVSLHRDVKEAQRDLNDLNSHVGLLQALRDGYSQRSYMLRELVALYLAKYYGDTPDTGRKSHENAAKDRQYDDNRKALNRERHRKGD